MGLLDFSNFCSIQPRRFQALSQIPHLAELRTDTTSQPNSLTELLGCDVLQLISIFDHLQMQLSSVLIARGITKCTLYLRKNLVFVHSGTPAFDGHTI